MNSGPGTMGSALAAERRALSKEVPVSYKRTEAGVIPQDWEVRTLGALGEFKNGINKDKQDFGHGFPFVNLMDVFGIPKISTSSSIGLVNSSLGERETYALQSGDVLFVRSSVKPEGVGLTTLILEDLPNTVFSGFLLRYRDRGVFELEFKEHCFQEANFRSRLIASSTVSANTNVSQRSLKSLKFAFPPNKSEQRAIAEALSDVDELLRALEMLIAKKQAIKQAAMQQLLTGKTRLPGFSGAWEATTLGEVTEIRNGATPNTQIGAYWDGSIPWCTPTDITSTPGKYLLATERSITTAGLASCAASLLPVGALLLCSRATIGEVKIAASPVCTNQGFKSLVCKDGVSNEFLYYLLLTLRPHMIERAIGSTFLEVGKRDVASIEVRLPQHEEQRTIAAVLSDMDAEIAALERRRDKTCAIKQGMMQQLLIGQIRLVKSPHAVEASA